MSEQTPVDTYEALYSQLQQVVAQLEQGELPLDRSLQLYEQGIRLASACQGLLDAAELRVQQLQAGEPAVDLEG
jgi:exodeoxyribonuclease VII small subunit